MLSACAEEYVKTSKTEDNFPGIAKQEYVPGTEDIPLYNGFIASKDDNINYDSADGRIIDATFKRDGVLASNVRMFYDVTLPQLGWNKKQYQIYERDGETLRLNILEKDGQTFLTFAIRPS